MIGNNTLHLNEATMRAAVQMYLNSKLKPEVEHPEVTSVKMASGGMSSQTFEVQLKAGVE